VCPVDAGLSKTLLAKERTILSPQALKTNLNENWAATGSLDGFGTSGAIGKSRVPINLTSGGQLNATLSGV
jgi:hypothetical protein